LFFTNIIGSGKQTKETEKSIAVLPFKLLSGEPDKQYLADGMMDAITLHLSKIKDLRVLGRTSVEQYRNPTKTTTAIGKELGVEYLLEGSFQKFGDNVKLIVQLIKTGKEGHVWANEYDRNWSDIFAVQSEVAQAVATELHSAISPEEKQLIEKKPTADLKAYEFYIRAQQLADSYWRDNETRYLPEAQRLLDKALEIDPGYEMAIVAKGGVFLAQNRYDSVLVYANRLMTLNPYSAHGYLLKGEYYNFTNVPDSAIKNYLLAIKFLNKNEISDKEWCEFQIGWVCCVQKNDYQKGLVYLQKGWDVKQKGDWTRPYMVGNIFLSIGDYEKSNKYYQMSLGIDESPKCIYSYSMSLVLQSRLGEALNFLDTICKEPQSKVFCNQVRFYIHLIRKEFDLAEQFYTNFLNAGGTPNVSDSIWLSYLYKETGKEQAAIILLKRCQISEENKTGKNINLDFFDLYLNLTSIYALLDNKGEALKNLTKSVDIGLHWGWHDFIMICPVFENLWDDPDFKAIVHRAQNEKATIRSQVKKMEQSGEIDL
jgi:TolB-like protein